MINKKVVIVALARDCNKSLISNIPLVEQLRDHFSTSEVVVIENDSIDGTKQTLSSWATKSAGVHIVSNDFNTKTIEQATISNPYPMTGVNRIEKMATYRNMYLDYIREHKLNPDYLIVIDIDINWFDVEGIIKTINDAPNDWGGLFAFGQSNVCVKGWTLKTMVYDMYAYIHKEEPIPFTNKYIFEQKRRLTNRINKEIFSSCTSAFGGMGIYKWELIKDVDYKAQPNNDKQISVLCEHISFNKEIVKQNYRLYISKFLVVKYEDCSYKLGLRMSFPECFFRVYTSIFKSNRSI